MNQQRHPTKTATNGDLERLLGGLHAQANRLREQGRYAESEALFRRALELAERLFDEDDVRLVSLLNNFAVLGKYSGNFDEAETCYRRALAIAEKHPGENQVEVATLYHNLGGLAHARGDYENGEPLARRAVEIRAALLGPDHPHTLADPVAWARLLDGLKRYDETEPV